MELGTYYTICAVIGIGVGSTETLEDVVSHERFGNYIAYVLAGVKPTILDVARDLNSANLSEDELVYGYAGKDAKRAEWLLKLLAPHIPEEKMIPFREAANNGYARELANIAKTKEAWRKRQMDVGERNLRVWPENLN